MEDEALAFEEYPPAVMRDRADAFLRSLATRRTVRMFSSRPVPEEVLAACLAAAHTAPSGANLRPWHFAVVQSPEMKHRIRVAAEEEEHAFYESRAPGEWLEVLKPIGTDWRKPFLETAPVLIAIFQKNRVPGPGGEEARSYYPKESTGLAAGVLIAALHHAGLATLTHTPSPMQFLNELLGRPASEKPFLLLVAGYPARECRVPKLDRVPLEERMSTH